MDKDTKDNWQKIKNYFEDLPEEKRDNMFYKRAVAICGDKDDPLLDVPSLICNLEEASPPQLVMETSNKGFFFCR